MKGKRPVQIFCEAFEIRKLSLKIINLIYKLA